ncbi:hypothetical protein VC83_08782 [Pseudogymnoascus destructans]|uniref:Uncharacterized protein n=2 Tax=Pseudogymnoascus destructans TaxID=655981 RepID=L8FZW6_PSED2|nr:uncharacterized protein VC83_08782 [Pseudogymnoascus destructans]ELR05276.1 hypothetical protein GMDG_07259 [Pseudogymnoascus destructans 20631-21]OAF55010.2 hypothetical protein VC83_08782 [Pseudogymnoascus destructans]
MVRKRIVAKPANPPPFAPTSDQDAQIEALATFLDTGSPLSEPIQSTGPPAIMPTFVYQGLPQGGYNVRSNEERGGSQNLVYRFQNTEQDMKTILRELDEEEERLWKIIDLKKAPVLVSKFKQAEGFERHYSQFRDSEVLNDLNESIGALTGHISTDEQIKLHAKLQSITEQLKATPLNTQVYLTHPDGSPNENAFEQEAAVQKMLQEISDLNTNIKLWANTDNKTKELANDAQELAEEAKEPVREKSDEVEWDTKNAIPKTKPLIIRSGQSYESISMPPMDTQGPELTADTNHSSPHTRDATRDAMSAPEPDVKTELEVKSEREQPAIQDFGTTGGENIIAADWAHLPTAKPVMYADVSHSKKNIDLWVAFWSGDKSTWDPLHEYLIGFPKSARDGIWEERMNWLRKGTCDPALPDVWVPKPLDKAARSAGRQIDKVDLSLIKELIDKQNMKTAVDSEQLFKKLEALQKPSQLWGNVDIPRQKAVRNAPAQKINVRAAIPVTQGPLGFARDFHDPTRHERQLAQHDVVQREDQIQKRSDHLHEIGSSLLDLEMQRHEAQIVLKRREKRQRELAELLHKREQNLKNRELEWEKHQNQRQGTEGLLKQREEHLHKREKQQQEIDGLLQKLEEKLQEREFQLAEREHSVQNRQVEWEKHQEPQREIERLLQQRLEQLQKRECQLQTRGSLLQTREDQSLKREDQQLTRDTLLQRHEADIEARIATTKQQATEMQEKLTQLTNAREKLTRDTAKQNGDIGKRTQLVGKREAAVASREKCLEKLRMSLHKQYKVLMDESEKACVDWGGSSTGDWPSVLELAVQVKMYVEAKVLQWNQNETELADLNKMAVEIEEEAKRVIFGGRKIKLADVKKVAAVLTANDERDAVVLIEAKNKFTGIQEWNRRHGNIPAATSAEDNEPTAWSIFTTEQPLASTLFDGCSGKWGCVCATCRERDNIWNVHMQASDKNCGAKVSDSRAGSSSGECRCTWGACKWCTS